MSPTILARFRRYTGLFGGKQGARSLHFLGLCAFAAFIVVHTFMVIVHGLPKGFSDIVLGGYPRDHALAPEAGLGGIFGILVFHLVISWWSLRYKARRAAAPGHHG